MGAGSSRCCCSPEKSDLQKSASLDAPVDGSLSLQGVKFARVAGLENDGRIDDFYDVSMNKLGEGSSVSSATCKNTKAERAVKSVPIRACDEGQLPLQIKLLRSFDHPNIVRLWETFRDAKCAYIVMDLLTGGDLLGRVVEESQNVKFTENRAATIFEQIISAVTYMHSNGIVHRDLRPENVMVQDKSATAEVKIISFGLAVKLEPGKLLTEKVGSEYYIAPEVLLGRYNRNCDIWSCGVLLYIILSGSPPFKGQDAKEVEASVAAGSYNFPMPDWAQISQPAKDLISSMLIVDESARPDADVVLGHQWLKRGDVRGKQPLPSVVRKLQNFNKARGFKKVCLNVIASHIPKKDIEDLARYFKSLDKNGDGTISQKELTVGLESCAKALPGMNQAELQKLMNIDSDGSGEIDYTEFIAASLDRQTYLRRDVCWSAFRTFDTDGNGSIEKHELKKALTDNAGNLTGNAALNGADLDKLISQADKNNDGKIDFEEFMQLMEEEE